MQRQRYVIEIRKGQSWRTAMDVLDLATQFWDVLPDWAQPQKDELKARTTALIEACMKELEESFHRKG